MARGARPAPRTQEGTARFVLRLPLELHRLATDRARALGLSLNEYCVRRLSGPELFVAMHEAVRLLLARATAVADARLIGLIAHGSWVRGEARVASDVDVLVVVEQAVRLSRALYRKWDEVPVSWDGRAVDAHFIHLPATPDRAGSVWCEAAVDGQVLFDTDGRVASTLVAIRRAIADGRLVRKRAHGQPYWMVAA